MPTINVDIGCGEQLQEIADVLAKSKKIVVVTGAGISTNVGIPDFRSENGLYALIQAQYDAATAISNTTLDFAEPPPAKRRRLARSASTTCLPTHSFQSQQLPTERTRQLRSSQSFTTNAKIEHSQEPDTTSSQDSTFPSSQSSQSSGRRSLPNLKGKDLFDSMIWSDPLTTSIFYTFISSLRKKVADEVNATTKTHQFLRILRDGGRLVRVYTQNIDGLEAREGLCMDLGKGPGSRNRFGPKIAKAKETRPTSEGDGTMVGVNGLGIVDRGVECVALHGGLESLRCGLCARLCSWEDEDRESHTLAGSAPDCPHCTAANATREHKGRRSLAIGRLRPDVVLYGEEHPCADQIGPLITHDIGLGPEVMLILGTSLRVHGLKVMVREFAKAVHTRGGKVIFVNHTKPPDSVWGDVIDYWIESDCDQWVHDLEERRKDIWLPQGVFEEKESKPKGIPKNPQSTRPDVTSGAYHTKKILQRLGRISGRITDDLPEQQLLDAQLLGTSIKPVKPSKPLKASQPTKRPIKRKQEARPKVSRNDRFNGAVLSEKIVSQVRLLCEQQVSRQLPMLPGLELWKPQPTRRALQPLSINAFPRQRLHMHRLKHDLPTPPTSDEPSSPPSTPKSIRTKMSITALLSSPMQENSAL